MQINICKLKDAVGKTLLGSAHNRQDEAILLVWHDDTYTLIEGEGDEDGCDIQERFSFNESDLDRFDAEDLTKAKVNPEIIKHVQTRSEQRRLAQEEEAKKRRREIYERMKKEFGE